jgi:hypothetical protein
MIAARNDKTISDVGSSVESVYLESLITPTNDVSFEIHLLQIGAFLDCANICLSRQTKFNIHKTLIRLVLIYGSETWVWIKREENQLLVFERKVLQTMCGPKIENGVCRRRYNHELDREFNSPNALNITKTSSLRYASHRIRRPITKSSIQSQTQWKEKSRKTKIQVGEQR